MGAIFISAESLRAFAEAENRRQAENRAKNAIAGEAERIAVMPRRAAEPIVPQITRSAR